MGQGTFKLFNAYADAIDRGLLGDLEAQTFKLAMVSTIPVVTAADPRFGDGGSTDLSANEVAGTGYAAGGVVCPNPTLTRVANIDSFTLDDPSKWVKDAAGPADIKAAVLYCSSVAGNYALGFYDYTTDGATAISLRDADISPKFPNGIYDTKVNAA